MMDYLILGTGESDVATACPSLFAPPDACPTRIGGGACHMIYFCKDLHSAPILPGESN